LCMRLRSGDSVCRSAPHELLLLCSGPPGAFARVRRRAQALWSGAWARQGHAGSPPAIRDEPLEVAGAIAERP